MSCTGTTNCACGCCAGATVLTPQTEVNAPGLSSISYRAGTWATFKETMLARLSSSDYPALAGLKTRADDDFTIAFLDASAMVLDILTFYQERLANESYLRTAVQLRSLIELSRLIGYQPAPGVSAAAYVAFTLKTSPGATPPDPSTPPITIPQGTQVQSVPAQGQKPQTFETSADIQAKPDWNALPVQTGHLWRPNIGDLGVYLQGTATQLQPGDLILIVGDERLTGGFDNLHWDVRVVVTVQPDTPNNRTYVAWNNGLGGGSVEPAQKHPRFYALRQRAALFGYNAVKPLMLGTTATTTVTTNTGSGSSAVTTSTTTTTKTTSNGIANLNSAQNDWAFGAPVVPGDTSTNVVDLDAVYAKVTPVGWIVLVDPLTGPASRSPAGLVSLYQVLSVTTMTQSNYGMSAKITRIEVESDGNAPNVLSGYYSATRNTSVFVQSDELAVAEQPFTYPLYGTSLDLEVLRPDLAGAQIVALSGTRQKLAVKGGQTPTLYFLPDGAAASVTLNPGDLLTLTDPTPILNAPQSIQGWTATASLKLNVQDAQGRTGTVTASLNDFDLAPSSSTDPVVSEVALVSSVSTDTDPFPNVPHTFILVQKALAYCYDRTTTTVNVNVGLATHGQSVSEVMGSGSASTPNQSFTVKQSPLTYVQAITPTGRQSTLTVQANGVAWTEAPSLYNQGPFTQVFSTLNQSDGTTDVLFGDGVEGATLPTGQNNIQANYRFGSGSQGNVAAGALSTLLDRPLGVSGVTNPQAATGGQDAASVDDVRASAPQTVLTLGRAVSITDYQNFAGAFAGIAKAYAIWIPIGPGRGVFLTVAGVDGTPLPSDSPTFGYLTAALQNYGNPLIPIKAVSYQQTFFTFSASVKYDPAYDPAAVQTQILQTLYQTYSFAQRSFGQGVSVDELASVIQGVPGVTAVNVTNLATVGSGSSLTGIRNFRLLFGAASAPITRICPYVPVASVNALPNPAEILLLDPDPNSIQWGVMS